MVTYHTSALLKGFDDCPHKADLQQCYLISISWDFQYPGKYYISPSSDTFLLFGKVVIQNISTDFVR